MTYVASAPPPAVGGALRVKLFDVGSMTYVA
jgi:hypothetical protein